MRRPQSRKHGAHVTETEFSNGSMSQFCNGVRVTDTAQGGGKEPYFEAIFGSRCRIGASLLLL
jgi:hypothetical protein